VTRPAITAAEGEGSNGSNDGADGGGADGGGGESTRSTGNGGDGGSSDHEPWQYLEAMLEVGEWMTFVLVSPDHLLAVACCSERFFMLNALLFSDCLFDAKRCSYIENHRRGGETYVSMIDST